MLFEEVEDFVKPPELEFFTRLSAPVRQCRVPQVQFQAAGCVFQLGACGDGTGAIRPLSSYRLGQPVTGATRVCGADDAKAKMQTLATATFQLELPSMDVNIPHASRPNGCTSVFFVC